MPTYIKLVDGDDVTVREDYRDVYERLLAGAWREPCELTASTFGVAAAEPQPLTVNPTYIVYFRAT